VALLKGITSWVRQEDWLDWHSSSKGIPWDESLSLLFLRNRNSYLPHLRGCTKRPEKPLYIAELLLASWVDSEINVNENVCYLLLKVLVMPKQLINTTRPRKPFRTASTEG